jgi:type I restriction enzyme M protein
VLKKQRQVSDNILFIDASAHYGKATNQNFLREEDLERILEAVEKRGQLESEKADKFSYLATLDEVKDENDFNLNIPRYVDTFEDEKTEDLEAIVSALQANNSKVKQVNDDISIFAKELNLEWVK